jgi:hypothetical protein
MRVAAHRTAHGVVLASTDDMDIYATSLAASDLARRIASEYREMPGLNLTVAQAERLWGVDHATCMRALTLLVTRRVLKRTPAGRYLRAR